MDRIVIRVWGYTILCDTVEEAASLLKMLGP